MTSRVGVAASALLLLLCLGSICGEYTSQGLSTFVDTMLAEYDREVPPQARTVVSLALNVRHATVDDTTATMRLLADLNMSWNDSRLSWNASLWENSNVLVSAERLWSPDVTLVNAGGGRDSGAEMRARLSAAGLVLVVRRLLLSVPVTLCLVHWPHDEQEAVFKFASRDYQDEIDFVISETKHTVVVESGAWEVLRVSGWSWSREDGEEDTGEGAGGAAWRVRVARRASRHARMATVVLGSTVLLLIAAAALPYQKRAPLAACAALIAAIWLVSAAAAVPAGTSSPRVVAVLGAACACAAACGAGAAAAAAVSRRTAPPPAALRALLTRTSALYTLAPELEITHGSMSGAWIAAAQLLDNLLLSAIVIILLVLLGVQVFS